MIKTKYPIELVLIPFKLLFSSKSPKTVENIKSGSILIFWNENSLGIILSGRILIYLLKRKFPDTKIILVVKNEYRSFLENKKIRALFGLTYNDEIMGDNEFIKILFTAHDTIIIPSITFFSFKSHFLSRLAKSNQRIGVSSLYKKSNPFNFMLNHKIELNWTKNPDIHFTEILLSICGIFGIANENPFSEIATFKLTDSEKFKLMENIRIEKENRIIAISLETDQVSEKWENENIIEFCSLMKSIGDYSILFIGPAIDEEIKNILNSKGYDYKFIEADNYLETLKIISIADIFITNNSDYMHLGGTTSVPQISLFGEYNPFTWAPVGENKKFIRVTDLVNDIKVQQVFSVAQTLLKYED